MGFLGSVSQKREDLGGGGENGMRKVADSRQVSALTVELALPGNIQSSVREQQGMEQRGSREGWWPVNERGDLYGQVDLTRSLALRPQTAGPYQRFSRFGVGPQSLYF